MAEIAQNGKTYVTVDELEVRTGYDLDYLRKLAREKKVDAIKIGGAWLINPDDLKRYQEGRSSRGSHQEKAAKHTPKRFALPV